MDLGVSGLASGFDWRSLVEQLADVERTPQLRLKSEQTSIQQRNAAYGNLKTLLASLQTRVEALQKPELFDSRTVQVSDTTAATADAAIGAPLGTFSFQFIQLATGAVQLGAAGIAKTLNATDDVSAVTLSSAGFSTPVTAGTFMVNGKQITIATSDSLQQVFDKISTATGGTVTGSYDHTTDKITLTGTGPIVLGSATDTSNFLQVAKLANNGGASVTSTGALGGIRQAVTLAQGNFSTPVSDGGAGAGEFKINGVSIKFSATGDSLKNVMDRINNSAAGVTASYDSANGRIVLTDKSTGDVGIALEDVTGNFLAATGLSTGTLQRGKDLIYTVNGGGQLTSRSNTIDETSSGIAGLTVTALHEGATAQVTVGNDTARIKTAIQDFLTDYNKLQSTIDSQTSSSTDAKGKVTAGVLAADGDASELASRLRSIAYKLSSGAAINGLADLGINTKGQDNSLTLDDEDKLDSALATNLTAVKSLFSDSVTGLAVKLGDYIDKTIGDKGTLVSKQDNFVKQSAAIDVQIADMERLVLSDRQRMIDSFVAMETAQAKINQQLQFLQQKFATTK